MAIRNPFRRQPRDRSGPDAPVAVEVEKVETPASPQEKAQCKAWLDTIADECVNHRQLWQDMRTWQKAAAGEGTNYDVHVNLHEATLETLLPLLYAQDPEVDARPEEGVSDERYSFIRPFCRTLGIVINRELKDAKLRKLAERVIRSVKVSSFGVAKVIFQSDTEDGPVIVGRINDIQDNLKQVAAMGEELAEGGPETPEDRDKLKADLENTMQALQERVEVVKAMGIVLDFVRPDDWMIPYSIPLEEADRAPWQAQRIWMKKDDAVAEFGLSDKQAAQLTTYACRQAVKGEDDRTETTKKAHEGANLVCCWEVWDKRTGMIYTLLEGLDRYAKEPFAPAYTGQRFYPYFLLGMSWVDGKREPLSAVGMADPLVQEYNGVRSGYKEHRQRAIPAGVFDKSGMDIEDVERLTKRERIELVGIDYNGGNVHQALGVLEYPRVDPGLYDTSVIRGELDVIYGVQDAMRGEVMNAKTATEAEIMQSGLGARIDGQRGHLEMWLQDIAQYVAEVLLLAMPAEQAHRIAGEEAVWPELDRADIYDLVQVEVQAGSTGKPNQKKLAKEWIELLPQLMPVVQQYVQAQEAGQEGIAEALKAIVEETLRRFDVRLDADKFLPKVHKSESPNTPPGAAGGMPAPAGAISAAAQGSPIGAPRVA